MYKKFILTLLTAGFLITGLTGCSQITSMRVSKQLKLADKYLVAADYEEAILALQKAIQIDPKNVGAHILLADTFAKVGRVTEADDTLKKAQKIEGITKDELAKIDEKLDSLNYIVGFSTSSGDFTDTVIITLSNLKNYNITYSLETDNQRLSATEAEYTSPIILDEDGDYKLSSYCTDESGTKHEVSVAEYVIKLDKEKHPNNSWESNNGIYRYRDASGHIATGWQQIDGVWYYLKENGDMATGWVQVDGVWYHFGDDGAMTIDTSVDGYTLGSDGTITGVDLNNSSSRNIFKKIYRDALLQVYNNHKLNDVSWDNNEAQGMKFALADTNGDHVDDLIIYDGIDYSKLAIFGVFGDKLTTMFTVNDMKAVSSTTQGILEVVREENSKYSVNYYKYDKNSHTFPNVVASTSFDSEFEGQFEIRRIRGELGLTLSTLTLHEDLTSENIGLVFE